MLHARRAERGIDVVDLAVIRVGVELCAREPLDRVRDVETQFAERRPAMVAEQLRGIEGAAEEAGIALEHQPAVEAEGRQAAAGTARAVGQRGVKAVAGMVQLQAGRDEPARGFPTVAEACHQQAARAVGLAGQQR